jgi:uncharacterized protein (TIGR02145 family)
LKSSTAWNESLVGRSGFEALPGGFRHFYGRFHDIGAYAYWWTSDNLNANNAIAYVITAEKQHVIRTSAFLKRFGFAVRCVKDHSAYELINGFEAVQIGKQKWMTTNLAVETFRNGEPIPQARNSAEWEIAVENKKPVWCYYNFNPENGAKYGKIYNWYAVNDPRRLAPQGWLIPSDSQWNELAVTLGGSQLAGEQLKSSVGWFGHGGGKGSDGFNALPGGAQHASATFHDIGSTGFWWTATEYDENSAWLREINFSSPAIIRSHDFSKAFGFAVRCIADGS